LIARRRFYSTLNISEMIQDTAYRRLLQSTNRKLYGLYGLYQLLYPKLWSMRSKLLLIR